MTAFTIKLLAILSMAIDHVAVVYGLHPGLRVPGRLAFPLFVFLIADSCRHTRSLDKFLLRLGLFALLSETPFDLAFNNEINFFANTNVFYTFFLGVLCVYVYRQLQQTALLPVLPLPIIGLMLAAEWLSSDFGAIGVLFVFLMALAAGRKILQLGIILLASFALYLPAILITNFAFLQVYILLGSLIAIGIAAFANGQRGPNVKWPFYLFYPGHLLLLALTSALFL